MSSEATCVKCGKIFSAPRRLQEHYKRKTPCDLFVQATTSNHPCTFCGRDFTTAAALSRHKKTRCKTRTKMEAIAEQIRTNSFTTGQAHTQMKAIAEQIRTNSFITKQARINEPIVEQIQTNSFITEQAQTNEPIVEQIQDNRHKTKIIIKIIVDEGSNPDTNFKLEEKTVHNSSWGNSFIRIEVKSS